MGYQHVHVDGENTLKRSVLCHHTITRLEIKIPHCMSADFKT